MPYNYRLKLTADLPKYLRPRSLAGALGGHFSENTYVKKEFERVFHVRWGDMDFNAHMKNTAYLDMSGDVRMMYFDEQGF